MNRQTMSCPTKCRLSGLPQFRPDDPDGSIFWGPDDSDGPDKIHAIDMRLDLAHEFWQFGDPACVNWVGAAKANLLLVLSTLSGLNLTLSGR